MFRSAKLGRLLVLGLLLGGFSLAMTAEADAGVFGRRGRAFRGSSSARVSSSVGSSVGRGRGYAVRGPSPLTIRVSSANYRRLTTFYPGVYRPR